MFNSLRSYLAQDRNFPWFCAVAGALVAAWVNYQAKGVINNDGVLYLEVARLFGEGQWHEGVATYNWPFYALLVMVVDKISGLGLQISANLLTVLFFAATAMGMVILIRDLGGSRRTMAGGLMLLIATPYLVGDILPMVAREHGYWASFVWSLIFFLRFSDHPTWKNAVLWGTLAIICVLFRIEGLTYLVAIPLVLLTDMSVSLIRRMQNFAKANAVFIALGTSLTILLLAHPTLHLSDFGRLGDPLMIAELVYQQVTSGLSSRAEVIGRQALGRYLDDYGMPVLLLGMLYIIVAKAFSVGGLLQSGLALIFWNKTKNLLNARHRRALVWVLILGLINAAVILIKGFVLPKRILMPIGFIVIILAAFSATTLFNEVKKNALSKSYLRTGLISIACIFLLVQMDAALRPSSPKARYERDAVEWVMAHAPPDSRIFFETSRMVFYAGRPQQRNENWEAIQESVWRSSVINERQSDSNQRQAMNESIYEEQSLDGYDYLLFNLNRKKTDQENALTQRFGAPLAIFEGPRGKKLFIYRNVNAK